MKKRIGGPTRVRINDRYPIDKILYRTDGFIELLNAKRSSSDLIEAMKHMAISSRCNQLGVVIISQTLARVWNSGCNDALLNLLLKKPNIFSLNFDVADFGNHVHDFVAMLLNNNNIEKTGLCLAWFGELNTIKKFQGEGSKIYDKIRR